MEKSKLKEIGFVSFEHLDKLKRDGKERMIWHGVYKDELIAITIIFNDSNVWSLDKILLNSNKEKIFNNYFIDDKSLENVFKFINCLMKG